MLPSVAVIANAVIVAMYFARDALPTPYYVMFTYPKLAIVNVMACKIFRDIRFGQLDPTTLPTTAGGRAATTLRFNMPRSTTTDASIGSTVSKPNTEIRPKLSKPELAQVSPGFCRVQWRTE